MADDPRWWEFRRAQNLSASVYRCPVCQEPLPALSEHMLLVPEGDPSRRRHVHTDCLRRARLEGLFPTRDEWQASRPPSSRPRRWWQRRR